MDGFIRCKKCGSCDPCDCLTSTTTTISVKMDRNYQASLDADRRERQKNKKRVRLIIGDKVRSFPLPEGCQVVLEVVQGDEVRSRHDILMED